MSAEVLLLLGEGQSLSTQDGVLLAQGQVQSLDEAGGDLARIDIRRLTMDHALGHRDEPASFPMLDQLRVTELGNGDLLRVARAPGTACTGLRHLDVPTVKQRHPVLIQTVAHKKRQTPDQDRGGASDQLAGAGLRAWGHHQREDQTLLGREGDPDPETPILARLAFCQPRKFFFSRTSTAHPARPAPRAAASPAPR